MRMRTLGLFVIGLVMVVACGAEEGGDTTVAEPDVTTTADSGQEDTATTTTEAMTTTTEAMSTTTAAESMDGVHVADTELGSILVDPEGFTLYIFTNDSEGESTCYDDCASLWPPVPADTPIGSDLDESMFGSVARDDGGEQLAVNGMPLYLYTPDANPGDTTGQGVGGVWFVVDAGGDMIEAAAATDSDDDQEPDPYDY